MGRHLSTWPFPLCIPRSLAEGPGYRRAEDRFLVYDQDS